MRERYGVDPKQVPDFSSLRGDPPTDFRARGVSEGAASLLRTYGSLEKALGAAGFTQAADLRLYRRLPPWTPRLHFLR